MTALNLELESEYVTMVCERPQEPVEPQTDPHHLSTFYFNEPTWT